jgi:hypothetical protein
MKTDFTVQSDGGYGSIYLLKPNTEAAREWVALNIINPEDAQRWGEAVAVEHRYIGDIVEGIRRDGLTVQ